MVTKHSALMVVNSLEQDLGSNMGKLIGHDFLNYEGFQRQNVACSLFAICDASKTLVPPGIITRVHRLNKGWAWECRKDFQLPKPPFLISDDERYAVVHSGPIGLLPTDSTKELLLEDWKSYGSFTMPLVSQDWIGVLSLDSGSLEIGILIAYSNRVSRLPKRSNEVYLPEENQWFGTLVSVGGGVAPSGGAVLGGTP